MMRARMGMLQTIVMLAAILQLPGCSDPLDDEAKGQSIPTHAEIETRYAAGSAQTGSDAGAAAPRAGGSAADAMPEAPPPRSMATPPTLAEAQGAGSATTTGSIPPAGLSAGRAGGAAVQGGGSASGQGSTSGAGAAGQGGN